jgi:hypothetical protein
MHACVVVQVATEVVLGRNLEIWIVHSRKDKEVGRCQSSQVFAIFTGSVKSDACSAQTQHVKCCSLIPACVGY